MSAFGTCLLRVTIVLIMSCILSKARKHSLRIIGGTDADFEKYQFVVRMEIHVTENDEIVTRQLCTSAYLTPIWMLTAAHCFPWPDLDNILRKLEKEGIKLVVRYGSVFPWKNCSYSTILSIKPHPNYKEAILEGVGVLLSSNDIALVKTTKVKLKRYAKLSAVDYTSLIGVEAAAMGYGLTDDGHKLQSTLQLDKPLQMLNVIIKKCPEMAAPYFPCFCISRKCGKAATLCWGDSGGPLVHSSGIVGVTSMGLATNCNPKTFKKRINAEPGIISAVSPFIEWISYVIKEEAKEL